MLNEVVCLQIDVSLIVQIPCVVVIFTHANSSSVVVQLNRRTSYKRGVELFLKIIYIEEDTANVLTYCEVLSES